MRDPTRWFKPLLFCASLLPLMALLMAALHGNLGINPIESLHHALGKWTLRFLLLTLLITPLRLLPGWSWLTRLRRMLGLFAFFYATLHLAVYIILDQGMDWQAIGEDIIERPYISFGMTAYLLLIPLAITSNRAMMQRLGKRWKQLHQLIYLIPLLGLLHFYLLVKADKSAPLFYIALFSILLILRIVLRGRRLEKQQSR